MKIAANWPKYFLVAVIGFLEKPRLVIKEGTITNALHLLDF